MPPTSGLARQATVFLLVLGAAVTVLDLVVVRIFTGSSYATDLDLVVIADLLALGAVLLARRDVLAGLLGACAASASVSATIAVVTRAAGDPDLPLGRLSGTLAPLASLPGTAEFGVIAVLLVLTLRQRPVGHAVLASVAAGAAAFATVRWRLERSTTLSDLVTVVLVVGLGAAVATGVFLRLLEAKRAREATATRAAERAAISRELHDVVGHAMTGIMLQAQAARLVLADRPELAANALAEIEHASADALRSMRLLVRDLRGDNEGAPLDPVAGIEAFHRLASAPPAGSTPVRLGLHPGMGALPAALLASLHRVALEAITNARRHGVDATAIDVRTTVTGASVVLQVDNDGAVVDPTRHGRGYGLVGIAERVHALGGTFTAGARPGGGWTVRAEVPLRAEPFAATPLLAPPTSLRTTP